MPNEFKIRNGLVVEGGSTIVTGSLNVTGGITGSLLGTASFANTASFVTSASFATTASFVTSASFANTASFALTANTASFVPNTFIQGGNSFGTQALLGTNDTQDLAFETSGSVRMFISSSGNVGIGTTTPTNQFTVKNLATTTANRATILIDADGTIDRSAQLIFSQNVLNWQSILATHTSAGGVNYGLQLNDGGTSTFVTNKGRMFIGNSFTLPSASLHVRGSGATASTTALLIQNSTPASIFTVLDDGSVTSDLVTSTSAFNIRRLGAPTTRLISLMANGGIRAQSFWGETGANANGDDGVWSFQSRNRRASDSGSVSGMLLQQEFVQEQFGQVTFNALKIIPTIATSGTANNLTIRGLYYEPFLNVTTGVTAHRAIETSAGDVLFRSGSSTLLFVSQSGNVGIGTGTPSFRLDVSGSGRFTDNLTVTGSLNVTAGVTGSLLGTASFASTASFATLAQTANTASFVLQAVSASYVLQAVSASFATLAQTANTASFVQTAQTASYVLNAVSASFATSASRAVSSSFATTASFALNGGGGAAFPFTGSAQISGSLTLVGNQIITGSLSQGLFADASGVGSHAEGNLTTAIGNYSHAEGIGTTTSGFYAHAEGVDNTAWGQGSHAEGDSTYAYGDGSHAEGNGTISSGSFSHAEGQLTTSSGSFSHAEGENTIAIGQSSHTEGTNTITEGNYSHAEGNATIAFGTFSHAEGINTQTIGEASHAEGNNTIAFGNYSHAEGESTVAFGNYSHAEGEGTIASGSAQTVMGRFNTRGNNTSLVVIGNGANDSNRSNLVLFNQNNVVVSSSLNVTSGITGSLFGTSSFATTASFALNGGGGAAFPFTGSAVITGSLTVTGSISNNVLSGSDSRVLVATSTGTLEATNQVIIQAYIDPNGTQASLLNSTSSWNVNGLYVGTAITGTYQGQKHYNTNYFFEAVDDNTWIRLIRG